MTTQAKAERPPYDKIREAIAGFDGITNTERLLAHEFLGNQAPALLAEISRLEHVIALGIARMQDGHGGAALIGLVAGATDSDALDECATCGEIAGAEGECPQSKRPCGHHCNCAWIHDCCHWCGAEMEEEGEYQIGAVVAYMKDGEPHLAWREPGANQETDLRWHVFHGLAFGWRRWSEIESGQHLRFLGLHTSPGDVQS